LRPFSFCEITVTTPPRLTRARLRELLHYDEDTGEFRWWMRVGDEVRLGEVAGHVEIRVDERTYRAHQLAWFYTTGRWGRPMIDHRDGNSTNNRWTNLRRATASQNRANSRRSRHNTSGFKGVCLCRRSGRWHAYVYKNGRRIHLGMFARPEAAHAAYVAAARKLFGEFARTE
jgi:HNH endonuclease